MTRGRFLLLCTALGTASTIQPAQGREEIRPPLGAVANSIESCVDRQPIRFQAADRRALLDLADAAMVSAALVRRYPIVDRDGLAPKRIVLWRKPGADWLYIALLENPARPDEICFTATFVASRFDVTPPLIVKYFGAAVAND